MPRPLGILVAGGRGRRLAAGAPKAHASLGRETLLERALQCLGGECDTIVLALSDGVEPPATLPPQVHVTRDAPGTRGPLAGLVAGMRARSFETALVLGVDFPYARGAALRAIAARLGARVAVVPEPGGRAQPLFAAYAGAARAPLERALARGEQALVTAVLALDPLLLGDAELAALEGGLENFVNVNRPDELAEARRRLGEAPPASSS
jgi:molybdopterin-guanine dinucleotide biosynthesis protein A